MSRIQDHHREAIMRVVGDFPSMKQLFDTDDTESTVKECMKLMIDFASHEDLFDVLDVTSETKRYLRRRRDDTAYMYNAVGAVELVRHQMHPALVGIAVRVHRWADNEVVSAEETKLFDEAIIAAGREHGWDVRTPAMRAHEEQRLREDPLAAIEVEAEVDNFRRQLDAWAADA